MALGKRNNGNFRLSSVEVGAPRIWIHLNRIRKKQMEEKIGTHGAKLPLLIHHQKDLPSALQNQVAFGPPPWQGGTAFAVSKAKTRRGKHRGKRLERKRLEDKKT